MKCSNCGADIPDESKFCTECGAVCPQDSGDRTAAEPESTEPAPIHLDNGITIYEGCYAWNGETAVRRYPAVFTLSRWIIGVIGGIAVLLLLLFADPVSALIAAAVTAAVYLLTAGSLMLVRGGKFRGNFALEAEAVTVVEDIQPPEKALFLILYMLFMLITGLVRLIWLFTGQNEAYDLSEHGSAVCRKCKYRKITQIIPADDGTEIILKKSVGKMKLLVTPEQCGMIVDEIQKRRRKALAQTK